MWRSTLTTSPSTTTSGSLLKGLRWRASSPSIDQPRSVADHLPAGMMKKILRMGECEYERSVGQGNSYNGFCGKSRRSEEHTSELQLLMRISYAVFVLKKKQSKIITN